MTQHKLLFIILFISSTLIFSGDLLAKKRRGAELKIQKTDGQIVKGELIAVKENSLLLLDSNTSADVSVDITDIEFIEILKKPKILLGAGLGFLIGGSVGALTGVMFGDDELRQGDNPDEYETRSVSQKALTVGVLFGLIGALGGGITGASVGGETTIQIQGNSEEDINLELIKLRFKARVTDFK